MVMSHSSHPRVTGLRNFWSKLKSCENQQPLVGRMQRCQGKSCRNFFYKDVEQSLTSPWVPSDLRSGTGGLFYGCWKFEILDGDVQGGDLRQ
jgi:hypothetical protein